jgi:hypothetical protein
MSLPKSAGHVIAAIIELTPEIRYAALASGQDVSMRQRARVSRASASDSDRFEELLVNPTRLTLARQRGEIDCGGLRYLVVGYGSFDQLVLPWRTDTPRSRSSVARIPAPRCQRVEDERAASRASEASRGHGSRSQEERRMQDHVSRLVGLEGFEVRRVVEEGDRLDLEVELVARAGCCPDCGRSSLEVKERPLVRVRDVPIADG